MLAVFEALHSAKLKVFHLCILEDLLLERLSSEWQVHTLFLHRSAKSIPTQCKHQLELSSGRSEV